MSKKAQVEANKVAQKQKTTFDVVKNTTPAKKVNIQFELEQKIIEILLLYGSRTEDFEDLILKENEEGILVLEPVVHKAKVFEKIYLDLQEDEMQFGNKNFKTIYYLIIDYLNQNDTLDIENFVHEIDPKLAPFVSDILMNDERYRLHNWEKNNIFPKRKDFNVAQLVSETILNLRCFLIDQKVNEFKAVTHKNSSDNTSVLEDVLNYSNLKMLLSRKLNRVL
jgi:DNA primase